MAGALTNMVGRTPPAGGSSARYWRLLFPDGGTNGSRCGIGEMEMRSSAGGADLTAPDPSEVKISANSSNSGSFSPRNAIDGGNSDFAGWFTADGQNLNSWLRYDFTTPVSINEISISALGDGGSWNTYAPKQITVQSSPDGTTWATEWVVSGGPYTWTSFQTRVFTRP